MIMTKREGVWVLAVAKAMLDVVAASVIVSLLLLSGDVEENPGPVGGIAALISGLWLCISINILFIHVQTWITTVLIEVRH